MHFRFTIRDLLWLTALWRWPWGGGSTINRLLIDVSQPTLGANGSVNCRTTKPGQLYQVRCDGCRRGHSFSGP